MFANRSVDVHKFSMIPSAEIPRSSFRMQSAHKTAFDSGFLVPIYCEEVLPGDTFRMNMTVFCRLATPIFPFLDNLRLDSFFFFVPARLLWSNWKRFMGERDPTPDSSISFVVPQCVCPAGGYLVGSLQDYFGLPTIGQVAGGATVSHSSLPLRAYNLVYNEWFRDENLQDVVTVPLGDGPDAVNLFSTRQRGKRHDYFTSCLPWPQKGAAPVSLPLGTSAPVTYLQGADTPWLIRRQDTGAAFAGGSLPPIINNSGQLRDQTGVINLAGDPQGHLVADLSAATAATINQLRQSFQIQRLLERDARGGTRYTEMLRAHFGVVSPDARLQRPEYLGGGSTPIQLHPIPQTSATGLTGGSTPSGNLSAMATGLAQGHGFSQSFTEHGFILGILEVRADLSYQQGLRRHWSRSTRYDYYFPAFAMLGEQAVLSKEIYCTGEAADNDVFGYQERWAEYRYHPSMITGLMRSTSAGTIDPWHLAQRFVSRPVLNSAFIQDTPPLSRVLAVGTGANGQQLLCDAFFDVVAARPMPMYSVPGLIDHF